MRARPATTTRLGGPPEISFPSKMTLPDEGGMVPLTTLKHVVLPAPFGPIRPTSSPRPTENDTLRKAARPPKFRHNPSTRNNSVVIERLRANPRQRIA